ncbi:MAG: cation diffusion facilitator family transporter [Candidatus Methanodesulfokora sp.]
MTKLAASSFIASLCLFLLKLLTGIITNSLGVLAEAIHSALDSLTSLITLLSVRYSSKPPDSSHTYGHRKYDSIGGLIGAALLLVTMSWVALEAINRLIRPVEMEIGVIPFAVMILAVIVDTERSRALKRAADATSSRALEADALHFSSDVFTSLTVIIGLFLVKFGIKAADPIIGLLISVLFLRSALKIAKDSLMDLTDRIDPSLIEEIRRACSDVPGIIEVSRIRARSIGNMIFGDISVLVDSDVKGDISSEVSKRVSERLKKDADFVVEVISAEELIKEAVRKVSSEVSGVVGVHGIKVSGLNEKRVSLHAVVDPNIDVVRAHEISDLLERKIKEEVPWIVEAIVHVDPADLPSLRMTGKELADVIKRELEGKRIDGYEVVLESLEVFDPPWTVNIRIILPEDMPLRKAHEITHEIELIVRRILPGATVTVHFSI